MNIEFTQGQIITIGMLLVGMLVGIFLASLLTWFISSRLMSVATKTKKAMRKLIQLLKNDLINKQPISVARIYRLIRSVGRREGIKLTMYIAPEVPLEDVELSLKEDEKLDLQQKEECIVQIEKILSEMAGQKRPATVSIELSEVIKSLREKIQKGALDELNEELVKLQLWYETADFDKKATAFRLRVVSALMLLLLVWICTGVVTFFSVFPQGYNWWTGWIMIVCPVLILALFALGYFNVWKDKNKI
ncbi:MAG: hypothetical protein AB1567_08155 [bacterium]